MSQETPKTIHSKRFHPELPRLIILFCFSSVLSIFWLVRTVQNQNNAWLTLIVLSTLFLLIIQFFRLKFLSKPPLQKDDAMTIMLIKFAQKNGYVKSLLPPILQQILNPDRILFLASNPDSKQTLMQFGHEGIDRSYWIDYAIFMELPKSTPGRFEIVPQDAGPLMSGLNRQMELSSALTKDHYQVYIDQAVAGTQVYEYIWGDVEKLLPANPNLRIIKTNQYLGVIFHHSPQTQAEFIDQLALVNKLYVRQVGSNHS